MEVPVQGGRTGASAVVGGDPWLMGNAQAPQETLHVVLLRLFWPSSLSVDFYAFLL